jgi:hypothetical protein
MYETITSKHHYESKLKDKNNLITGNKLLKPKIYTPKIGVN